MTLKTDFYDGANGFNQKMEAVFDAGVVYVTDNLVAISTALKAAAAQGRKDFTLTLAVAFEPANLRILENPDSVGGCHTHHNTDGTGCASHSHGPFGTHWKSFSAGVLYGLADEDVFNYEVSLALNVRDIDNTRIDFHFTF